MWPCLTYTVFNKNLTIIGVARSSVEDSLTFHTQPQFSPGYSETKKFCYNEMEFYIFKEKIENFLLKLYLTTV